MKRAALATCVAGALVGGLSACGGSSSARFSSPCDLVTTDEVAVAFQVAVNDGVAGTGRNCEFALTNPPATGLQAVEVYLYSGGAAQWDSFRQGFADNRGGVTDITDVGEKAFSPKDKGANEIDGLSGDVLFGVGSIVKGLVQPDLSVQTKALAKVVAANAAK